MTVPGPRSRRRATAADRHGHLPAHRHPGLDGAWPGPSGAPGTRSSTRHHAVLREAIEAHDGQVVRTEGDAVFAAFQEAGAAVAAAVDGQRALAAAELAGRRRARRSGWALHSGEAHLAGDDYGGFDVNRAARVAAAGHGGQIVLSDPTQALVADALPADVSLVSLGRYRLRGVPRPETLWQVRIPGLRDTFPPLRVDSPTSGNLPERLTSFVGRDRELDDVVALLGEARLVTLTGPGGIGKSSLAVEAARRVAADVARWRLVRDPRRARRAGSGAWPPSRARWACTMVRPGPPPRPCRSSWPSGRRCSSSTTSSTCWTPPTEVGRLLRASPQTRILVTSRAPLRISGEHEYPVRPLEVAAGGGTARQLFVERARAVVPDWQPGADERTHR